MHAHEHDSFVLVCVQSISLEGMVLEQGMKSRDESSLTVLYPGKKVRAFSSLVHERKTSCVTWLSTGMPPFLCRIDSFSVLEIYLNCLL